MPIAVVDNYQENADISPAIAVALSGITGVKEASKCEEFVSDVATRFSVSQSCNTNSKFVPILCFRRNIANISIHCENT